MNDVPAQTSPETRAAIDSILPPVAAGNEPDALGSASAFVEVPPLLAAEAIDASARHRTEPHRDFAPVATTPRASLDGRPLASELGSAWPGDSVGITPQPAFEAGKRAQRRRRRGGPDLVRHPLTDPVGCRPSASRRPRHATFTALRGELVLQNAGCPPGPRIKMLNATPLVRFPTPTGNPCGTARPSGSKNAPTGPVATDDGASADTVLATAAEQLVVTPREPPAVTSTTRGTTASQALADDASQPRPVVAGSGASDADQAATENMDVDVLVEPTAHCSKSDASLRGRGLPSLGNPPSSGRQALEIPMQEDPSKRKTKKKKKKATTAVPLAAKVNPPPKEKPPKPAKKASPAVADGGD